VHRHALGQVEVEAQAVEPDQRPLLTDVRAEDLLQRGLQQVRRGVVAAHALPHPLVHRRKNLRRKSCIVFEYRHVFTIRLKLIAAEVSGRVGPALGQPSQRPAAGSAAACYVQAAPALVLTYPRSQQQTPADMTMAFSGLDH